MIPTPEESNINYSYTEKDQNGNFPRYLEEKSKPQNEKVQLCSTPPLPVSGQESRKRSSVSPTHFSKKERILQSLIAAAPTLFPNRKVDCGSTHFPRKRSIKEESEIPEVTQKRICPDESSKENKPLKLRGKLTLLVVGENGNVLWKESASKEKIVSNFESFITQPLPFCLLV